MLALTLTQPWASLVALGAKAIETRSWGTSHRGPIAIHAAKALPKVWRPFHDEHFIDALEPVCGLNELGVPDLAKLPVGAVLAVVWVVDVVRTSGINPVPGYSITDSELAFGNYDPGRYAWILEDVMALPVPFPAAGRQRLWRLNASQTLAVFGGREVPAF